MRETAEILNVPLHELGGRNIPFHIVAIKRGSENIIYEPGVTYVADPNDNWWKENRPEIGKTI